MEKPLDLSNREEEEEQRRRMGMGDFPSRDDPICQRENCDCPLKHIIQLGSQNKVHSDTDKPVSMQYPFYKNFIPSQCSKRPQGPSEYYNLKRRRVNMYNDETQRALQNNGATTASAPESSATCDENRFDHSSGPYYGAYAQNDMNVLYQNGFHANEDALNTLAPSTFTPTAGPSANMPSNGLRVDLVPVRRERSKSATNVHMMSKKSTARRYSPDHIQECGSSSPDGLYSARPSLAPGSLLLPGVALSSPTPPTSVCPASLPTEEDTKPKYDAKSIKADMIREIDNQKDDDEDIQTFRRKLFDSFMKPKEKAKAEMENKAPTVVKEKKEKEELTHAHPMTSLDYLISKTLMENEDKPFKARNDHIHEIIRGEKRGRLCLMDLVELQVEMGLA